MTHPNLDDRSPGELGQRLKDSSVRRGRYEAVHGDSVEVVVS